MTITRTYTFSILIAEYHVHVLYTLHADLTAIRRLVVSLNRQERDTK